MGKPYKLPDGVEAESKLAKEYLAGKEKFKVKEIEVFQLTEY